MSVVWAIAVFQPAFAVANETTKLLTKQPTTQQSSAKSGEQNLSFEHKQPALAHAEKISIQYNFKNIKISGVTQNISLSQISSLWQDFGDNKKLQSRLKKNPSKVYVYYRNFSSDYESAEASIGYGISELSNPSREIKLPATNFESLLVKGKYTDMQIQQTWKKVDYRKDVVAIVEVHNLNADNSVNSSEIFVSYK